MCFKVTLLDNRNRLLEITVAYVRIRDFLNESPLSSFLPLPGNLFCCSLLPIKVITLFLCSALPLVSPAVLHTLLNLFIPPFCHLQNGNNNCTYFVGLLCRVNYMPACILSVMSGTLVNIQMLTASSCHEFLSWW